MKTFLIPLAGALATALLFSSCNSTLRVEQRHYRSGVYTSFFHKQERSTATYAVPAAEIPDEEYALPETIAMSDNDSLQGELISYSSLDSMHTSDAETSSTLKRITAGPSETKAASTDTVKHKSKLQKRLSYNGPPEAKKATNMHRLGRALMIVGLIFFLFILFPILPFLGFLAWAFLAGMILEIVAIALASEGIGKYSGNNEALAEHFRALRRKAIWTVTAALFVWLVIVYAAYITGFFRPYYFYYW